MTQPRTGECSQCAAATDHHSTPYGMFWRCKKCGGEPPADTNPAATPQPVPQQTDRSVPVFDLVMADMQARKDMGLAKYGTLLTTHNGRDALLDLEQELLDAVMYLRQARYERDGK